MHIAHFTSRLSSVNLSVRTEHTQQVYARARVLVFSRKPTDATGPLLHNRFLIHFIPSVHLFVCQTICLSVRPHPPLALTLQVESLTPLRTGEDVGYLATLAFKKDFRISEAYSCLLFSRRASCCRCVAIYGLRPSSDNLSSTN